ncbi:MgtC/SapB family protein, partial [Klebsiella pneumoniae]
SRLAAQIVSGIGFIGAGVIFVRQDAVRGLTTAATIWVAAAVGTAAGAGLWLLASVVTAAHFLVAFGYARALRWLTRKEPTTALLHMRYEHRRGMLRSILAQVTDHHFTIQDVDTRRASNDIVHLSLRVRGKGDPDDLTLPLLETDGVQSVRLDRDSEDS